MSGHTYTHTHTYIHTYIHTHTTTTITLAAHAHLGLITTLQSQNDITDKRGTITSALALLAMVYHQ